MSTRTEVRSPTRTEVRSPTRTSTRANTRGNFTSTVTGGAGAGPTSVTINIPSRDTGSLNHYPIAMSGSDTGSLDYGKIVADIPRFILALTKTPQGLVLLGGSVAVGALIGGKKHRLLGGGIGLVAGPVAFSSLGLLIGGV